MQDSWDIVGGAICGLFIIAGVASILLYKPWKRWVDRNYLIWRRKAGEEENASAKPQEEIESIIAAPEALLNIEMVPLHSKHSEGCIYKGGTRHHEDVVTPA